MKKKAWKRLLSAFTAVTLTASAFAAFSLPAMAAFAAVNADTGVANGISNGGDWSIYSNKWFSARYGKFTNSLNSAGSIEVTGSAEMGAAFYFDLSSMNDMATDGKVIKNAKLRFTQVITKGNNRDHALYTITNDLSEAKTGDDIKIEKTVISSFTPARGSNDELDNESGLKIQAADITAYPDDLKKWQTDLDVTGEVIAKGEEISFYIYSNETVNNKTEYLTTYLEQNTRVKNIPFLYNNGTTDYSKWAYPQIIFTYTDDADYIAAYKDFTAANTALSAASVSADGYSTPAAANGSTVTLAMYGETAQPLKVESNKLIPNNDYAGVAKSANVVLTVTKGEASYSRIVSVAVAESTPTYEISFDSGKNPKGVVSVTVGETTYTDGTAYAKEGAAFTVDGGANTGFTPAVTVKDSNNQEIKAQDGSYTMPAGNVSIEVAYNKTEEYGTTRIAAINSASVEAGGNVRDASSNLVLGANRLTFLKFDVSGYSKENIAEAKIKFTQVNSGGGSATRAIFYSPNDNWTEKDNMGANFCLTPDNDDTKIQAFVTANGTVKLNENGSTAADVKALIVPDWTTETTDLSAAANGILKDYYIGDSGSETGLEFDFTSALKAALEKEETNNDKTGIITLMVYTPSTASGKDIKSVTTASSLAERPSLIITEKEAGVHNVNIASGSKGKITVEPAQAKKSEQVTVTVTDTDNYAANSLTASYEPYTHSYPWGGDFTGTYSIPITAGENNTYTFTMPDDDVDVSALFCDNNEIIVASKDQAYDTSNYNADSWHYIQTGSRSLALGFDMSGIENFEDKRIKLKLQKTGAAAFSATSVRIATTNPWAGGSFETAVDKLVTVTGASSDSIEFSFKLTGSELIDNYLYLNVEMDTGSSGNDYYGIKADAVHGSKQASLADYLPQLIITEVKERSITTRSGVTAKNEKGEEITKAYAGEEITLSGDVVKGSLIVKTVDNSLITAVYNDSDGTYTFTMPDSDVSISAIVNETNKIYVVPTSVQAVNAAGNATNNYYIKGDHALGMTFEIPELPADKELDSVSLHFTRQNSAANRKTNIYDQTSKSSFAYPSAGDEYIAWYDGGTIAAQKLDSAPNQGTYKLLLAYDSSVASGADGNDYYVVGAENTGNLPKDVSQLPYLVFSFKTDPRDLPQKQAPTYELQTDTLNNMFQYHFAGGTTEYNNSDDKTDDSGKAYDVYLWVPQNVAPGELKGLVAIKMNLVEVPFAYSQHLRDALANKGFGILFLVCQKDPYGYNNTLNGFYTRTDSDGKDTIYAGGTYTDNNGVHNCWTTDNKDAAQIMNELLTGIAEASRYSEIADTTPLITIGHSAASGFGNKSANWNKDRIIAQIHMKNGMSGGEAMVAGVPQLQYAAQYTEHAMGADRDRTVRDARYHIKDKRAVNTDYLVSHIIEWGSGHYDWSENATYILTEYIKKAIDARLPDDYDETGKLNDLTDTGYLMKPFEKTANGAEQDAGYYRDYLQGWLSDGKANSNASEADKKASFWFFDKEFADLVNEFTNYAIPESPDSSTTGISGATYSEIEPFMLMKNPSESTYANTPVTANTVIKPYRTFATDPFSRYGRTRFINYTKMAAPDANSSNTANLQGYGTVTVDTYYMDTIPTITAGSGNVVAYDGAGKSAYVPENTKAEFVPIIAPYEVVGSEQLDMSGMTKSGDESENVASVTRTTLRFHNDRVYFRSGNLVSLKKQYSGFTYEDNGQTKEFGVMDSYGFIKSPEIRGTDGFVTSAFKATSSQMNVPYVAEDSNRTTQTLTLDEIGDVNVNGVTENPKFAVKYESDDKDLEKFTDVMVEYGPARAVRSGNDTDGYTWEIEVLLDQIPKNATYPIEVNVVASNLGKWEKVTGATSSQTFNIIWGTPEITGVTVTPNSGTYTGVPVEAVTVTGAASGDTVTYKLDGGEFSETVPTVTEAGEYEVTVKVARDGYADFEKTVTVIIKEPSGGFGEDYAPSDIKGVNEYDEETPLSGWFSNDVETNSTAVNSVKTENGQLIMSNGENGNYGNLWVGKAYATQEEAEAAAKIIIKFRYTPGSVNSRIYLASASDADVSTGLDSDTVYGTYKTAAELGMKADTTYDVTVTIDNSKHEAVFAVGEKADISPMSISLLAYVNLTARVPEDTNTVIFRPAASATDKLDYFSAELLQEAKPALKIGEITQSEDKTTVAVSVENPTEETEAGVMIAALYSLDGVLKEIKADVNGAVEFNKTTEGYVKLFLWSALSGDNAMVPLIDTPAEKDIQ